MKKVRFTVAWVLMAAMLCTDIDYVYAGSESVMEGRDIVADMATDMIDAMDQRQDTSVTEEAEAQETDTQGKDVPKALNMQSEGNTYGMVEPDLTETEILLDEGRFDTAQVEAGNAAVGENIASGTWRGMDWVIDADGLLTVSGTYSFVSINDSNDGDIHYVDLAMIFTNRLPGWYKYRSEIKKAKVMAKNVDSIYAWFYKCTEMESVDLSEFDASKVVLIRGMFDYCSSLTSLDLSKFDTSEVTVMYRMFDGCSGLTSLDVSKLNTSKVTKMNFLFEGCSGLTSLDVSKLDTSNVTDMSGMFWGCSGLTSLNINGLDTSKVTNMGYMFGGCSGLTSLDVSKLDTSSVTNMYDMFSGCSGLTSLNVNGLNTGKVTNMESMFKGCSGLTSLDVSKLDTSNVTDVTSMFSDCFNLASLNLSGFNTSKVAGMSCMFDDCESLTSLDVSGFDTSNVKDMMDMFHDCKSLTSLDLSTFNTSQVTDMSQMFMGCNRLRKLDISGFDTGNVTLMNSMFCSCGSLASLDISGFDTSKVTNMMQMFKYCRSLTSLDLSKFDTSNVTDMSYMLNSCSSLTSLDISGFDIQKVTNFEEMFEDSTAVQELKTFKNLTAKQVTDGKLRLPVSPMYDTNGNEYTTFPTNQSEGIWLYTRSGQHLASGTWRGMDWVIDGEGLLTVSGTYSYEGEAESPGWYPSNSLIKRAKITAKGVKTTYNWFANCENMVSVDLSEFDTSNVTDMSRMFYYCKGLTSLDLSKMNTGNVQYMNSMFFGCIGLTSLDVSNFNTSNVVQMNFMFDDCRNLANLDVSKFDTSKATDMRGMFSGCCGLTSLDVSNFNTSNVRRLGGMFNYCSGLTSLDVSRFDISNVTDFTSDRGYENRKMFEGTTSLKQLKTFRNLTTEQAGALELPVSPMYDTNGNEYTSFPANLPEGIWLYTSKEKSYPVENISLSKTELSLQKGGIAVLTAAIEPQNATNQKVTWSSSNDSVVSIDGSGLAVTLKGNVVGTATVTVKTEDGGKSASCKVTVTEDGSGTDTPEPEHDPATANILVVKQKMDITDRFIVETPYKKYSVMPKGAATVSAKGILTVKKPAETLTVTGLVKDGKKWIEAESVTVKIESPAITQKTITATKPEATIDGNDNITGTTIKPTNWITSKPAVAEVDAKTGVITTRAKGTTKITAVYGEGKNAAKYTFSVKVNIPVMSKTKATALTGATLKLKLKNVLKDRTSEIKWASSDDTAATVDSAGKVTVLSYNEKTEGKVTITATIDEVSYSCDIVVKKPEIKKSVITIKQGKSGKVALKNTKLKGVKWTSSNEKIATVDEKGKVTGVAPGTAIIQTTAGGVTSQCEVTVQ